MKINKFILLVLIMAPIRAIEVTDFKKSYPTKVEKILYPTTIKEI